MLEEVEGVLHYPKIQRRLRGTEETIARFVALLRYKADIVAVDETTDMNEPDLRDPDGLAVLQTFSVGEADLIVSGDADILVSAGKYPAESPSAFLRRL